jgi:NADPH:quinone reductase-like Zn-dependent oxidoreductase
MRAALFHQHGGPEVVRLEEVPRPEPEAGEVLIRVRAAAMNHLDLWARRGLPFAIPLPHIGGSDVVGTVEGTGERVVVNPGLWCGRCTYCAQAQEPLCVRYRILGEHIDGGFAEFVAVPATHTYPIPDDVAWEVAACLPVSYGTAWRAVFTQAAVRPGEKVLVLGASGGTAIAAIQIAKLAGARVFAVTRGAENVERVRGLGADVVYDRAEADWSAEVFRDTDKQGVDVVIENVGEATWKGSLRALGRGGRLVTYGGTTGPRVEIDLRQLFWKQIRIIGTTMATRAEWEAMLRVALRGELRPVVDSVMPLAHARSAHERLEAGGQFGKIVLVP